MTGAEHIAVSTTIDATTIDAVMPTVDRDVTDATDVTINLIATIVTVEAMAGRDATATNVERRQ